ncbi:hypothetical protein CCACVL1_19849 [Corchorus capsularis]|uniref:Uncharacterized protein n=1 Tax=Corchorus capsularis TaxID=210143 RepID=A0A1R3HEH0_COCAP|nr:hypothetical protein CCACVL1_19849 [Corchorus capsularis]
MASTPVVIENKGKASDQPALEKRVQILGLRTPEKRTFASDSETYQTSQIPKTLTLETRPPNTDLQTPAISGPNEGNGEAVTGASTAKKSKQSDASKKLNL